MSRPNDALDHIAAAEKCLADARDVIEQGCVDDAVMFLDDAVIAIDDAVEALNEVGDD